MKLKPENVLREKIKQLTIEYVGQSQKKRLQENFQFLFKHAVVFLREKLSKEDTENLKGDFYQYYFSETADKRGISLNAFKDPLIQKHEIKRGKEDLLTFRTFSREFLLFLVQSEKFKSDFLSFIHNEVKEFYIKKIPKKLNSIRIFICKM